MNTSQTGYYRLWCKNEAEDFLLRIMSFKYCTNKILMVFTCKQSNTIALITSVGHIIKVINDI